MALPELLRDVLVIDIETVGQHPDASGLDETWAALWQRKAATLRNDEEKPLMDLYAERAGIYAEFGQVIVVGLGAFYEPRPGEIGLQTKMLMGTDERALLIDLADTLKTRFSSPRLRLCAHNGKEFDFPYLGRRYLANQLPLPGPLQLEGKKPWEIPHIDTMELWKFGDRKSYTSLDLLAAVFGLPTSKGDIDGSQVHGVYHKDGQAGLERITVYCQEDIALTAQLLLCLWQRPPMEPDHILRTFSQSPE